MQRDTDFTFEDILGCPTLQETDISKYVAATMKASESTNTLTTLRFLCLPELGPEFPISDVVYTIPISDQHDGEVEYIAVSYCWDSFPNNTSPFPRPAQRISIIDQGVAREPRCPVEIILRAANFARSRGISLIWIDQECIDQTNNDDVQNHLQCMHHIYRRAKFTVGLLNFELANWSQYMAMIKLAILTINSEPDFNVAASSLEYMRAVKEINFMTRLLKAVRKDPWFSRTWVFQERYSSEVNMYLLFRTSSDFEFPEDIAASCEDIAVSCENIGSAAAVWFHTLRREPIETPELDLALRALHTAAQSVCTIFHGAPFEMLVEVLVTGQNPHERQRPLHFDDVFHHIESCDNKIVSDRVAIFANVLNLGWRINPTGLSSYSLSLLTILQLNEYLPRLLIGQVDENNPSSLFVHRINTLSLIERALQLQHSNANGLEASTEDLLAVNEVLKEIAPLEANGYETTESFTADFSLGGRNHDLLPLLGNQAPNIMVATVIPMSATMGEIFSAIIRSGSVQRVDLSHSYGNKIVQYAIENGQLPEGATFLAFYGQYCWKPEFINDYFAILANS
ncbi:heterokaryon incompatibility protein-domain-containing protein [Xylariaceae sp. AK1471]|nr:heterokaryon incompatibility protein-domain-containing protein [Xylariaceae sp. AK1471]